MRAAVLHAPGQISTETVEDPTVVMPTDAGPVFTSTIGLEDIAAGYDDMDKRRSIKVLVKP